MLVLVMIMDVNMVDNTSLGDGGASAADGVSEAMVGEGGSDNDFADGSGLGDGRYKV